MAAVERGIRLHHPAVHFFVAGGAWLLIDQVVKAVERHVMTAGQSVPLIKGVFHFTYIRNNGAAFSLLTGRTWLFLLVAALACAAIAFFWRTERPHTFLSVYGSALLIAGALGNVLDRIFYGYVIDIFDARVLHFAIFNWADIGITVGAVLMAVWLLFFGGFTDAARTDEETPQA